uniref:Uncharacterized protein n=1 Tax=Sphaerodactylus townsendi TaxID=933632 RepID=A0ACB8ENX9_9SAUR
MGDRLPEPTRANPSPAVAASAEAEAIEVLETEDVLPMATEDEDERKGISKASLLLRVLAVNFCNGAQERKSHSSFWAVPKCALLSNKYT